MLPFGCLIKSIELSAHFVSFAKRKWEKGFFDTADLFEDGIMSRDYTKSTKRNMLCHRAGTHVNSCTKSISAFEFVF